jgi:hypothetical protein
MADELLPEERRLAALRKLIQAQAESSDSQKKSLAIAREQMEIDKQLSDLKNASSDQEKKLKELLESRLVALKTREDYDQTSIDKTRELLEEEDRLEEVLEKQTKQRRKQQDILSNIKSISSAITGIDFANFASLTGLTTAFIEFSHELDKTRVTLGQTTGFTDALNQDMENLAATSADLGLTIGDAGAMIGELTLSMTEFAAMSERGRAEASKTAAELSRLGVDASETGKALDILSRGMGLSTSAANKAGRQFDMLAQQVGLPTSQVVADFNKIGPQLAKFGKRGTDEFAKLTKQARSLGMTIDDAFSIADAFDTFEGAADLAGKLNAQLGLQLNSIELMKASEADRIKLLQKEFKMQGKNFDEMSRREKQAIAEIMGVDVDMASRLFGDPVKLAKYQKSQEEMRVRAEKLTTAMDQFKVTMQEMFLAMQPVFNGIIKTFKFLVDYKIAHVVLSIAAAFGIWTAITKAYGVAAAAVSGIQAGFNALMGVTAVEAPVAATATATLGTAASLTGTQMLALGAAVALVGAGIGFAALGVSYLVASFKGMGAESIAAVAGIVALGTAFYYLVPAVLSLGSAAAFGAGPLLALGGAVALIGLGVGLAAVGIGEMAKGVGELVSNFKGFSAAEILGIAAAFTGLGASFYGLSLGLAAFATPWAIAGIAAFGLMTYALQQVLEGISEAQEGLESFDKIISVTTKIKTEDVNNMKKVVDQVVRVTGDAEGARAGGLNRLADALESFTTSMTPATASPGGGRPSTEREIRLELNHKLFGKAVIDVCKEYLNPTAFK